MIKLTGIYRILNIVNGKSYIGSTAKSFKQRFAEHRAMLKHNKHHSIILQRAWDKYKAENFRFEIIDNCARQDCIRIEQHYLDILKPEYNISPTAGSTLGRTVSEATRLKMSLKLKGRKCPWAGQYKKGMGHTAEQIKEINKIKMRKKRSLLPRVTKEERIEIHRLKAGCKKAITRSDGESFSSIREAARRLGCHHSEISRAMKRNLRVRGHRFFIP